VAGLFASGRIVDAILLLMLLEAAGLAALGARSGRGPGTRGLFTALLPGAFLLLALRSALTGQLWIATAGWLALALLAHAVDIGARFGARGASR
jgi:hypothetical protein